MSEQCPKKKCGEFNMLMCSDIVGHPGDCCFVLDHEADAEHAALRETHRTRLRASAVVTTSFEDKGRIVRVRATYKHRSSSSCLYTATPYEYPPQDIIEGVINAAVWNANIV
jgi:hypothetical protein